MFDISEGFEILRNQFGITKQKLGKFRGEIEVNEDGAKQSALPFRFDLIDPKILKSMANVLYFGQRKGYSDDNWRKYSVKSHLNHAMTHLMNWMMGQNKDLELEHFFCRAGMALAVYYQDHPLILQDYNSETKEIIFFEDN